jgi:hypothetical protein
MFQHLKDRQDLALRAEIDRVVRDALDAFGREVQAAFWETLLGTPCDPFDGWKYACLLPDARRWSPLRILDDAETSAEIATQRPELRGYRVIGAQTKPVVDGTDVARCVLFRGVDCGVAVCVVVRTRDRDATVVAHSMYTKDRGVVDTAPACIDEHLDKNPCVVRAILWECAALGVGGWAPRRGSPDVREARAASEAVRRLYYAADAALECIMKWWTAAPGSYRLVVAVRERGERWYHVWDVRGAAVAAHKVEPDGTLTPLVALS